ncbi:MAG: trigger factor, partial [Clostridia bacterium]|nr:trigger factor [Clostridia bacterium]
MKDQIRPGAEKQVKTSLVLEKIAKVEKIKVTDKDVEKELEKMAEQSGMSVDDVKKYVDIEGIKDSKLIEKTVEFIVKNAEVK